MCGNLQMGAQTQMGTHKHTHVQKALRGDQKRECGFGLSTVKTDGRRHLCRLESGGS